MNPATLILTPEDDTVRFDVSWAADFAEAWLFRHVPKVILSSATMTAHTAALLGIEETAISMYDAGAGFDPKRRPVYVVPVVRVDHRWTESEQTLLRIRIDQFIEPRVALGRKGIIHTGSYARRDWIMEHSAHRHRMVTHSRHNASQEIERFKRAPPGTILVSPSVTTGYDFPGDLCRWQVILKIPFPDTRDPIIAARKTRDKDYPSHVAMQELVQMVGRPVRSADDWAETIIMDAHATWFLNAKKKSQYTLAPRWFWRAVRASDVIPAPFTL